MDSQKGSQQKPKPEDRCYRRLVGDPDLASEAGTIKAILKIQYFSSQEKKVLK
jgi:hypothetical protein